ncbi:hypothetical protein H4S06_000790 [Coemansia sp. BCRC 34490]|nr:hypothetical protein H4S06_000790 [Coemansia sp. BCRC 34490]
MNIVASSKSSSAIANGKNPSYTMPSGIITPSTGSLSSVSLDSGDHDGSGYAQEPSQKTSDDGSWGLGIVLKTRNIQPLIDRAGMGMGGLMTTQSPGTVETETRRKKPTHLASSLPPTRVPTKSTSGSTADVNVLSMSTTDVTGATASFFQRLATSVTSFMSTTATDSALASGSSMADRPKSQIEDMLESYYLSQGKEVPYWVRNPPPDPAIADPRPSSTIVLANPSVPRELNNATPADDLCSQQQLSTSMDFSSREGSSQPGASNKSMIHSFARLNISRLTRNPFNKGLQSSSPSASDITKAVSDSYASANKATTKPRGRSTTPQTKDSNHRHRHHKHHKHQHKKHHGRSGDRSRGTSTAHNSEAVDSSPVSVRIVESTSNGSQPANSADDGRLEIVLKSQKKKQLSSKPEPQQGSDRESAKPMSPFSPKRFFAADGGRSSPASKFNDNGSTSATPATRSATPAPNTAPPSKKRSPFKLGSPKALVWQKEKRAQSRLKQEPDDINDNREAVEKSKAEVPEKSDSLIDQSLQINSPVVEKNPFEQAYGIPFTDNNTSESSHNNSTIDLQRQLAPIKLQSKMSVDSTTPSPPPKSSPLHTGWFKRTKTKKKPLLSPKMFRKRTGVRAAAAPMDLFATESPPNVVIANSDEEERPSQNQHLHEDSDKDEDHVKGLEPKTPRVAKVKRIFKRKAHA